MRVLVLSSTFRCLNFSKRFIVHVYEKHWILGSLGRWYSNYEFVIALVTDMGNNEGALIAVVDDDDSDSLLSLSWVDSG